MSDRFPARVPPDEFVRELWAEVERHPAVAHPFLRRFAEGRLARWQICGYASQHYQLVGSFTAYLEAIAGRTPDPAVRRLLRGILEDEYMRPQAFERSHPALYRRFMRAVGFAEGAWDRVPTLPATRTFIVGHLDMTFRSWLEALGAVGPGHEWAIPRMFPYFVQGIDRRVAVPSETLEYFRLHIDLDVEHGRALEAALLRWAPTDADQVELRRGARRSLDTRAAFWSALAEQLFSDSRDLSVHSPANPRSDQALGHVCATLNALESQYPGTTLTLVYEAPGLHRFLRPCQEPGTYPESGAGVLAEMGWDTGTRPSLLPV